MKRFFVIALIGLSAQGAFAGSQVLNQRGMSLCEAALNEQFEGDGLVMARQYYIKQADSHRTYYINGTVWENSERAPIRATCETTANARNLLGVTTHVGEYVVDGNEVVAR